MISDNNSTNSSSSTHNSNGSRRSHHTADELDERKVKDLNREIMMIFQMYKSSFSHASAALLSVLSYLSENYIKQHPESKKVLSEYFEKEFDKFLNKVNQF
ncbi:MAG TPA: hypothetical protein VIP70_10960 [Nitrososphaeraceae archaeon]